MQFETINIMACPSCGNLYKQIIDGSGNKFGQFYWSDGFCMMPMLEEPIRITKCHSCETIHWIDEADVVGQYKWFDDNSQIKSCETAVCAESLSVEEIVAVLKEKDLIRNKQDEVFLRKKLLWAQNHKNQRYNEDNPEGFEKMHVENLTKLESLLDPSVFEDRILIAEINREMGNFEECIKYLDEMPIEYQTIASKIKARALGKSKEVFEVN